MQLGYICTFVRCLDGRLCFGATSAGAPVKCATVKYIADRMGFQDPTSCCSVPYRPRKTFECNGSIIGLRRLEIYRRPIYLSIIPICSQQHMQHATMCLFRSSSPVGYGWMLNLGSFRCLFGLLHWANKGSWHSRSES